LLGIGGWIAYRSSPEFRRTVRSAGRSLAATLGLGGSAQGDVTYWCPMHPDVKRKGPETCPICNMALVPLVGGADESDPNLLTLTDRQVQQAGVRLGEVRRRDLQREIETVGTIEPDQQRVAYATAYVAGRIERLHKSVRGERVVAGEPLVDLFSPELIRSQRDYLRGLDEIRAAGGASANSHGRTGASARRFADEAKQRLLRLGLSATQVEELERTRKVPERITLRAPQAGTLLMKHVEEGDYVKEGSRILSLVDLSQVWLQVAIYEEELPLVHVGDAVEVELRSQPGQTFPGTVAFVEPFVDTKTRTTRVRIEVPNPSGELRLGQYAKVRLLHRAPSTLAVPDRAVLRTGRRQVVIVAEGNGRFRPVEVRLGLQWLYGDATKKEDAQPGPFGRAHERYDQVLAGLVEGQRVVTSGAFLVNAEAEFQSVMLKLLAAGTGLDQDPASRPTSRPTSAAAPPLSAAETKLREAYLALAEDLAKDDLTPMPTRAEALESAARALKADRPALATAAGAAAEAVRSAGEADDVAATRRAFGALSAAVVARARTAPGWLTGLDAYECPMADSFGFKVWLQPSGDMRNPYMGQAMLRCGSPTTIETATPPALPERHADPALPEPPRREAPRGGSTLDAVLQLYQRLSRALVEDNARALAPLPDEVEALAERAGGEQAGVLRKVAADLRAAGDDLDRARSAFGSLSKLLLETWPGRAALEARGLRVFQCPMADRFGFELWAQPGDQLENPYMGQAMLRCGGPAPPPVPTSQPTSQPTSRPTSGPGSRPAAPGGQ